MQNTFITWLVIPLPEIYKAFISGLRLPEGATLKSVRTFTDPANSGSVAMEFTLEGEEPVPDTALNMVTELSLAREVAERLVKLVDAGTAGTEQTLSEMMEAVERKISPLEGG